MHPPGLCLPRREEEGVDCLASRRSLTLKNEILICVPVRAQERVLKIAKRRKTVETPSEYKGRGRRERIKN